jgi:cyclic dehypoxanthinyl futalosine synthase
MGISREQALDCFRSDDLMGIGMEADAVRRQLHPEGVVSYVVERSIDGTAFVDANFEAIFSEIGDAVELGCTGIRLLGAGGLGRLEALIGQVRERFPSLWIEALSVAEALAVAQGPGLGLGEVMGRLRAAGLDSIKGDGAEIGYQDWVEVHRAAHGAGMRTVATGIFGGGETLEQRVEFLEAVRNLQEKTGAFSAFALVSAEAPGGRELDGMTAVERLKTLAISRMFLDNIENVQASRAGQGLKVLQMGLRFGANDVGRVEGGGAGAENGTGEEDLRRIIRDAGFQPAQRDAAYRTMFLN